MCKINEFQECLNNYISPNEHTEVTVANGSEESAKVFFNGINEIVFRDNPDAYIRVENVVYIIEHFEYDATKNHRNGSQTRIEEGKISRAFSKKIESSPHNIFSSYQMNVDHSATFLKDNFNKIFTAHFNKLEQYQRNLLSDGVITCKDKIKIVFCCEDKTTFGCLCYGTPLSMEAFKITNIKECLETIVSSSIDSFIFFNTYVNDKEIYFIDRKDIDINAPYVKKAEEINMIDFKPNVIGCSFRVPIKRNKEND